ncbi:Crp/Fnr family transcriptional regulator [Tardibacter chloracetimidivorans]|uniref:Crp/Fnr family transcriptional regulator n=1 Tax=Tardibacter chloracetimidivorans TaxID=1921510 RepID=UPI0009F8352A|nr:Crp/Fnr family transcriptional regulator [Tardibacter chloracetimidivorans]
MVHSDIRDVIADDLSDSVSYTKLYLRPHQFLARENESQPAIYRILEGWAHRFRLLPDGRRQVTRLFLPGDYCEMEWAQNGRSREPIVALTNLRALRIECDDLLYALSKDHELEMKIWSKIVSSSYQLSEWITNLGRKTALERLSYLFCEIFERLRTINLTYDDQFVMPLTQTDLADITGLTSVHVNRTLKQMREKGLIELQSKWLRIVDMPELRKVALFQPEGR